MPVQPQLAESAEPDTEPGPRATREIAHQLADLEVGELLAARRDVSCVTTDAGEEYEARGHAEDSSHRGTLL